MNFIDKFLLYHTSLNEVNQATPIKIITLLQQIKKNSVHNWKCKTELPANENYLVLCCYYNTTRGVYFHQPASIAKKILQPTQTFRQYSTLSSFLPNT